MSFISSHRNTRAHSFTHGRRDESASSVVPTPATTQNLNNTTNADRLCEHGREAAVTTLAQASESDVRRGRRDSVMSAWVKYNAWVERESTSHNLEGIPASLRPGYGKFVTTYAAVDALHLPPTSQAQRNVDAAQSGHFPSHTYHNPTPIKPRSRSQVPVPNTPTSNYLPHDRINEHMRNNRRANSRDSLSFIEVGQLDANVPERLRSWFLSHTLHRGIMFAKGFGT